VLLLFSTLLFSCENSAFLAEPPYSFTSPENFYKNESDLKMALVGCYSTINTKTVPGDYVPDGTYDRGLLYMLQGGDEEVTNTTDQSGDFARLSYLPTHPYLSDFWAAYFAGINRCNLLIEKAADVDMDSAIKEQIIAEARFLRAFFYWHLTSSFGGVPVTTSSVPDNGAPRDDLQTVFSLILEDLEHAYNTLNITSINVGGANKWTAAGYL